MPCRDVRKGEAVGEAAALMAVAEKGKFGIFSALLFVVFIGVTSPFWISFSVSSCVALSFTFSPSFFCSSSFSSSTFSCAFATEETTFAATVRTEVGGIHSFGSCRLTALITVVKVGAHVLMIVIILGR